MKILSNKKKKIISITILSIILIGAILNYAYLIISPYYRPIYSGVVWEDTELSKEENVLLQFIKNKLTDEDNGIYTNYINDESVGDITKGHAVISESEGLILLYNLERDNREEFDKNLEYIKQNMIMENNLLSWRIENGEKINRNSTIDDLRVIKALLLADEKWDNIEYRKLALKIASGIKKEVVDNNSLSDFYDGYNKSDITTLCYLDLPTLRMLSNIDYRNWKSIYDKSIELLDGGYISDEIPLYAKSYNRLENTYDEEDIDTLLSMIIILNKIEDARDVTTSISWIKNKFKKDGKIFAFYSRENGEPISDIESTAIYSILVQIGSNIGDFELEVMAMNRIKEFQIKNPKSEVYGGFGDEKGSNVFSYDNLNALIAFSKFI